MSRHLRKGAGEQRAWLRTIGGICLVIGTISLLFGAAVGGPLIAPTDNPSPLAISAATDGILLFAGCGSSVIRLDGSAARPNPVSDGMDASVWGWLQLIKGRTGIRVVNVLACGIR